MKRSVVFLGVLALCGFLAAPAAAADKRWHLRVFAAGFDPDLDVMVPAENPELVRVTADSDLGFGAGIEYQISQTALVGAALAYRPILFRGWTDSAGQRRADRYLGFGLAHIVGLEVTLELREPLPRW